MAQVTMGIAVFVKTPGLSPIKTRLAAGIGAAEAFKFYALACSAVRSSIEKTMTYKKFPIAAYWAIAEARSAGALWTMFPVLVQGEGGLGDRLHKIYDELMTKHGEAVLIGADCPQISPEDFFSARAALDAGATFAMGRARDGGFYLFAGRARIPKEAWLAVKYSAASTANELMAALAPIGKTHDIGTRTDADEESDLRLVVEELRALPGATEAQLELRDFLT